MAGSLDLIRPALTGARGRNAMEHWFDDLTRRLARQPVDRRRMMSWSAKLGVAAAGFALLGRTPPAARAAPARAPAASTCTVEDSYGVLKAVVTTQSAGSSPPLTYTHTFVAEVGSGNVFSTVTVAQGSAPQVASDASVILRMTTTSLRDRAGSASATFGPLYTGAGVRRAAFTTDGSTVSGVVDGRAVGAVPIGTDVRGSSLVENGLAADSTSPLVPAVQRDVSALLQTVATQPSGCGTDPNATAVVSTCTRCQLDCREAWFTCSVGATQASLASGVLLSGAYLHTASTTCDAALQQCLQSCKSSGACCPDFCNGDPTCCASAWGCCPPSSHSRRVWSRAWPTCPRSEALVPLQLALVQHQSEVQPFVWSV